MVLLTPPATTRGLHGHFRNNHGRSRGGLKGAKVIAMIGIRKIVEIANEFLRRGTGHSFAVNAAGNSSQVEQRLPGAHAADHFRKYVVSLSGANHVDKRKMAVQFSAHL